MEGEEVRKRESETWKGREGKGARERMRDRSRERDERDEREGGRGR